MTGSGFSGEFASSFVARFYPSRIIGALLGFVCVATSLSQRSAPAVVWVGLVAGSLVWPHIAYLVGRNRSDSYNAELRNLMVDSAFIGFGLPLVSFNLVSCAALIAVLNLNNAYIGGLRMLAYGVLLALIGALLSVVLLGFHVGLTPSLVDILGALPLMLIHPVVIAFGGYRLSQELEASRRRWRELSRTDGLTGLDNRRCWEDEVASEFERFRRYGAIASLVLLDIDYFKSVNDRYGHGVGDRMIRDVAACINGQLRKSDRAGRYGGEEFGILLPDTGAADARRLAERLRERIARYPFEGDLALRCTVSLGIAELGPEVASYSQWIDCADEALYEAKGTGRNRAVLRGCPASPGEALA